MAINPREQLQQVIKRWLAVVLKPYAADADAPVWQDWRNAQGDQPNAILEAEQALSFLLPQDALKEFRLEFQRTEVDPQWRTMLEEFGGEGKYSIKLALILRYIRDLLKRELPGGEQNFATPAYFDAGSPLRNEPVVDSFSLSVTLCLVAKRLARRIRLGDPDVDPGNETFALADEVWELADARLTASLRGLLAAFAVNTAPADSWHASAKSAKSLWAWPGGENDEDPGDPRTIAALSAVKKRLVDLGFRIGKAEAFECGWSWGVVARSDTDWAWLFAGSRGEDDFDGSVWNAVKAYAESIDRPAENAPYLYFTVVALDGIEDLLSPDVEASGLLNGEQTLLSSRIKTLESIVRDYWEALAISRPRGDSYRDWLIERIPWRTADGQASVYWNLYLLRIIIPRLARSEANDERLLKFCERLAETLLILREPVPSAEDPALELHWPGLQMTLGYFERLDDEPGALERMNCPKAWVAYDASVQLLKVGARLLSMASSPRARIRWSALIEEVWKHIEKRHDRHSGSGRGWDRFDKAFPEYYERLKSEKVFKADGGELLTPWRREDDAATTADRPDLVASWYMTERVVEALVSLVNSTDAAPQGGHEVRQLTQSLLVEFGASVSDEDWLDEVRQQSEQSPGKALMTLLSKMVSMQNERG